MERATTILETPCIEWSGYRNAEGYGRHRAGSLRGRLVHRAAWEEAHGPVPPGLVVMHLCDNPPCFRLDHLRLGTTTDNIRDARQKGRLARGEASPQARLTEAEVAEIRRLYAAGGATHRQLGERFGVSHNVIGRIVRFEDWAHVPCPPREEFR